MLCQGIRGCAIFLGILFAWKFWSRISILKKNSKALQDNILLVNRPNFFVEHMIWSQNQPYCFMSGTIYTSVGKITENVKKKEFRGQILKKITTWCRYWQIFSKAGCLFWPNFLKLVVTKIQKMEHPLKNFQSTPPGFNYDYQT